MDWGNEAEPASPKLDYYPEFRMNTFRIVGQPLHPVVRQSSSVNGDVTISWSHWQALYSLRHANNTLPFQLNERTFRFASGPEKQIWFIVLHPVQAETLEAPESLRTETVERSTIQSDRAQALSIYLNGLLYGHDKFWKKNHPAFHVLDHGDDTSFKTPLNMADVPMEVTQDDNTEVQDTGHIGELSDDEDFEPESEGSRPTASGVGKKMPDTGKLGRRKKKLEVMYDLNHIDQVSYTISAMINCSGPPVDGTDNRVPMCLLADRSGVCATYGNYSTLRCCAASRHRIADSVFDCIRIPPEGFKVQYVLALVLRVHVSCRRLAAGRQVSPNPFIRF
ncbi:hypothetical protein E4U36_007260 [Claviceps purpurea]|nr:hypothetical protein E4U36_007260 [Claviceps purpurea]